MTKLYSPVRNKRINTDRLRIRERESLEDTLTNLNAPAFDGYCWNGNGANYLDWEKSVHAWMVRNHRWGGFEWFDIERDSFGPLVRGLRCVDNEGKEREFYYG